jgi:hypothetical protein
MAEKQYDRSAQDLGNIVNLGHVNVCITDQHLATHYYVTGLGLTRDPFLNTGAGNMWINVGVSQFHLPMGQPDVLRGITGLVMPDRAALLDRLTQVRGHQVRLPREQRLRRDRLPVGQPHPRPCAGRGPLRPHRACPISNSTSGRARRSASRGSIARSWGRCRP